MILFSPFVFAPLGVVLAVVYGLTFRRWQYVVEIAICVAVLALYRSVNHFHLYLD